MPNLVYLYTSGGAPRCDMSAPVDICRSNITTDITNNRYALAAQSDGMIHMLKTIAQTPNYTFIDRFTALIDSTVSPGHLHLDSVSTIYVVRSMSWAMRFISPGDILIVRGGFKPWIPLLDYIHAKRENWILFYRANTNRHSWPYWDITLNDLIDTPKTIRGRLHYPFTKPVNEDIFGVIDAPNVLPREYDVMVGASHIHRRKGQYLTVKALQKHYHKYGTKPRAIMPGGYMRCSTNQEIQTVIKSGDVDIDGPCPVSRQKLSLLMNRTKLFIHAGYGGQNDRGILESMSCGAVPLLFGQSHVSPDIWKSSVHISQDPDEIADTIHDSLRSYEYLHHPDLYGKVNGLHEVAIPKMLRLLSFIEHHPTPDRLAACERFIST